MMVIAYKLIDKEVNENENIDKKDLTLCPILFRIMIQILSRQSFLVARPSLLAQIGMSY